MPGTGLYCSAVHTGGSLPVSQPWPEDLTELDKLEKVGTCACARGELGAFCVPCPPVPRELERAVLGSVGLRYHDDPGFRSDTYQPFRTTRGIGTLHLRTVPGKNKSHTLNLYGEVCP